MHSNGTSDIVGIADESANGRVGCRLLNVSGTSLAGNDPGVSFSGVTNRGRTTS